MLAPRWLFFSPDCGLEPKSQPFVDGPCSGAAVRLKRRSSISVFRRSDGKGIPTMTTLISILITFLVVILVLYLVNMLPIEGRAKQIVRIIIIIIGVLSLLKYLGVGF
jgi:hypothetical protein